MPAVPVPFSSAIGWNAIPMQFFRLYPTQTATNTHHITTRDPGLSILASFCSCKHLAMQETASTHRNPDPGLSIRSSKSTYFICLNPLWLYLIYNTCNIYIKSNMHGYAWNTHEHWRLTDLLRFIKIIWCYDVIKNTCMGIV